MDLSCNIRAMNPILLALMGVGVAGGIGVIVYRLIKRDKKYLILYVTSGEGASAFRTTAEHASQLFDTEPIPANNAQDILNAFRGDEKYDVVVLAGHGTPTSFLRPGLAGISSTRQTRLPNWINVDDFVRRVSPNLASRVIFSFAGCRTGADPGEADWTDVSYRPGGAQGLAGKLRDALARQGKVGEVRSKSTTGTSWGNPIGRLFPIERSQIGRPGVPLMDVAWGPGAHRDSAAIREWTNRFRGKPAMAWTIGYDLPSITRE